MAELLSQIHVLETLDPNIHWFCNNVDGQGSGKSDVLAEAPTPQIPRQIIKECYQIFSYDGPEVQNPKEFLVAGIETHLGKCDICIVEYYRSKKEFLDQLREDYNDEDVEALALMFHQYDVDRICRGLDDCTQTLKNLPEERRNKAALSRQALHGMIEALTSEKFLVDEDLVSNHLVDPLALVQTNEPLYMARYVPAISEFLASDNTQMRKWALSCLQHFSGKIHQDEFEFAFRGGLHRCLARGSCYPLDPDFVQNLWCGLKLVVDRLDNNLVTHSLRALENNLYMLALDHLHVRTPGIRYILQTLQKLWQISAKDFWDALGAIGPSAVADQIFMSYQFGYTLQHASEQDFLNSASQAADMLQWTCSLLAAVSVGQRPPLCRTIVSQLMQKIQTDNLSNHAKVACFDEGLRSLKYTLETCNDSLNMSETISFAVIVDALNVARTHFQKILNIINPQNGKDKHSRSVELCVATIQASLVLECKALRVLGNMLQTSRSNSGHFEPELWNNIEGQISPSDLHLNVAVIFAIRSAVDLEFLSRDDGGEGIKGYNHILRKFLDLFVRILHKINSFSPTVIRSILESPSVIESMAAILPTADNELHESAIELVRTMTVEAFRKEAIRRLMRLSLKETLCGLSLAALRIESSRIFGSCPIFLRICGDAIEALCDPQDGILRQASPLPRPDLEAVDCFWERIWHCLTMMYDCCESWSTRKVAPSELLKEFVRDVMQLSETLFGHFVVFDNAMQARHLVEEEEDFNVDQCGSLSNQITEKLLRSPSSAMDGVTKFLRLKDEYLLRTSVQLVRMLLSALTKAKMTVSQRTSEFLVQIAIYMEDKDPQKKIGIKTLLSPTEIAGIAFDLEQNKGQSIVENARLSAMSGKHTGDNVASNFVFRNAGVSGDMSVSSILAQPKKQGTINFRTWTSQAGQMRGAESKPNKEQDGLKLGRGTLSIARSTPGLIERRVVPKPGQIQKTAAQQEAFLNERKKAKQEADARRAEAAARIKKKIPGLIAGQTSGEGSALAGIGLSGKEHTPKGENMMVSSGSESEAESDDDFDKEIFGIAPTAKSNTTIAEFNAARAKQMKAVGPVKKKKIQRSAKDMRARLAPQLTSLWGRLLSWDFFHDKDFPPGTSKADYSTIHDVFRTTNDYRRVFENLLLLEAWSNFRKCRDEGGLRVFEIKISSRITVDSLFEITVTMEYAQCKSTGLLEADVILISKTDKLNEDVNAEHCLGRIHRLKHKKGLSEITIQVAQTPKVYSWLTQNTTINAARVDSIVTLEREYGALVGLEWYDLCQEIIHAEISPILKYTEEKLDLISKTYKLNGAQAKAVQSAVDNDAFTLIQGPPGSGKTKTIVAIVGAILSDSLKENEAITFRGPANGRDLQPLSPAAPKKLLVCAPSNAAVDELVMRFMSGVKTLDGRFQRPNIVRLGRSEKVNPQVLDVTLDELVDKIINPSGNKPAKEATDLEKAIESHKAVDKEVKAMYEYFDEVKASGNVVQPEVSQQFERLKRERQNWSAQIERLRDSGKSATRDADVKRRQVEQKILGDAHIICATLSGSARESFQHLTIDFETVVIDEAAQCIELSALIPLKYGCSKCIMVGDPKQLPPTVLSREAARFQYEQSLFVRMQRQRPEDVHLLDTQYRMHPYISQFPSRIFYEGKLLDGPDMATSRVRPWHKDDLLGPYRFYDVAGKHETAPKGHSLVNKYEVEVAMELYERLISGTADYDFHGKIGIITPYKSQLKLLSEKFAARYGTSILKSIEFNTTDAFQGRESEIIIFSCVRASEKGIGFLADIRRMNVGITRAKSSLWVLGNSVSLMQGEFWRALIMDARERGLFTEGNVLETLRAAKRSHKGQQFTIKRHLQPYTIQEQIHSDSRTEQTEIGNASKRSSRKDRLSHAEIPTINATASFAINDFIGDKDRQNEDYHTAIALHSESHRQQDAGTSREHVLRTSDSLPGIQSPILEPDKTSREATPLELKRKRRGSSPTGKQSNAPRIQSAARKSSRDDAAFIKPKKRR